jgi:signal transduction histidine kinase/DNA-binding response OmpR family regulator
MTHLGEKRILLVTGDAAFAEAFRGIRTTAGSADPVAPRSDSGSAWETVSNILRDLAIETVDDLAAAEIAIRRGMKERHPYYLAVVDLDAHGVLDNLATLVRAWHADASLLVVFCGENAVGARETVAGALGSLDGYFFLPKPLDRIQTCQLLASQLDRRLTRDRMLFGAKDLGSARRRLERAVQIAEEAEHFKAQFIANVSHEIRTPMNAILGFSRLLMKEGLSAQQQEKVRYVHDAGNALSRLIDNMLDFSKLAAGELKLSSREFDLGAVLEDVWKTARPAAQEKGLSIHCRAQQSIPRRLRGDGIRFRQILANLIDNAVKFTELGSIHVQTTLDEEADSLLTLRTVVTDTGIGIPPDRQGVVFDSFAQADGSATRSFGGMGLGLTICKRLADLMGGQIGFRSTPGEGSSFWFTTVFLKQDEQERRSNEQMTSPSPALSPLGSWRDASVDGPREESTKYRVLAADDNPLERVLIEAMLTRAGCIVDLAVDGKEAMTVLMNNRYDVVLMDLQMARMQGLEVLRRLRNEEPAADRYTVFIAMTAGCTGDQREECLRAGADDFLTRPFTPEELFQTIGRLVPGFLESLGEAPDHRNLTPDDKTGQPETLPDCMAALRLALDAGDFNLLEDQVCTLDALATRAGAQIVADHAMRIRFAARGRHPERALAAIDRLEEALRTEIDPGKAPGALPQPYRKTENRSCSSSW